MKFGMQKVLEIVQEHITPASEVCVVCGLCPFMIAASYKERPLSVVYFLLRQVPFLVNCNSTSAVYMLMYALYLRTRSMDFIK